VSFSQPFRYVDLGQSGLFASFNQSSEKILVIIQLAQSANSQLNGSVALDRE
jgi:hypothetical protein